MVAQKKKKRGGKLEGEFGKEPIDPKQLADDMALALRDVAQWEEWMRQGKLTTPAELEMVAIHKAKLEKLREKRRYYRIRKGSPKSPR